MIILSTKWLLRYFKLEEFFLLKNDEFICNDSSGASTDKERKNITDLICKILTARYVGDSINYELSAKKLSRFYFPGKISSNIDLLSLFFLIEDNLINCAFNDKEQSKNIFKTKDKILSFCNRYNSEEKFLLLALLTLSHIFYGYFDKAKESLREISEINGLIYLKSSLSSFLLYQEGDYKNAYQQLEFLLSPTENTENNNIFRSVCLNFLTYLYILDGKYSKFQETCDLLEGILKAENSNLQPIIISNILYLRQAIQSESSVSWTDHIDKHHDNVLLYKKSKELGFLSSLKNDSLNTYNNEIYDKLETYGKETVRFTNAPNAIGDKLTRLIFLYSYFGSFSGVTENQALLHKIFLSLGISSVDQTMIKQAAHYAIIRGATKEIDKTFKNPKFIKNSDTIGHCKKLIIQNKFGGPSAIGLSSMIRYIHRFLDNSSIIYASEHLASELKKQISFNSAFDHVRPALEASFYLSDVMKSDQMLHLFDSFLYFVKNVTLNMISVNEINQAINQFSDNFLRSSSKNIDSLTKFYFDNLPKMLKIHYETTFLALKRLIVSGDSKSNRDRFLNVLTEQVEENKNISDKIVFLYEVRSNLNNSITREESQKVINIIQESVLNPNRESYRIEKVSSFDPISLFSKIIPLFNSNNKQTAIFLLKKALFDPRCSISNKIQITLALERNKKFIDFDNINEIQKFLFKVREDMFLKSNKSLFFSFRSNSMYMLRALLYRLTSAADITWADSYLLDLLRISVSTDHVIRQIFIDSAESFCKSNPDNEVAIKTLLNRCYELSFDNDPEVKGISCSGMLSISTTLKKNVPEEIVRRLINLSKDSSEIVRLGVAEAIKNNKDALPKEVFEEIKDRFSKDIDFYVRTKNY